MKLSGMNRAYSRGKVFSGLASGVLVLVVVGKSLPGLLSAGSGREPVWEEKSLNWYLNDLKLFGPVNETPRKNTAVAFQNMGTNMIPHLRVRLRAKDSWSLPFWTWIDDRFSRQTSPPVYATPAWMQKKQALRAIPTLGFEAEPLIPELLEMLADSELAYEAAWCLSSIGSASIPSLVVVVSNPESLSLERSAGIYALGFLAHKQKIRDCYPALLSCLNDPNDEIRKRSVMAVRNMPDIIPEAMDFIIRFTHHSSNPAVSKEARKTIEFWQRQYPDRIPQKYSDSLRALITD